MFPIVPLSFHLLCLLCVVLFGQLSGGQCGAGGLLPLLLGEDGVRSVQMCGEGVRVWAVSVSVWGVC